MLMGKKLSCATDLTRALGSVIRHLTCSGTGCFIFLKALSSRKWAAVIDTQAQKHKYRQNPWRLRCLLFRLCLCNPRQSEARRQGRACEVGAETHAGMPVYLFSALLKRRLSCGHSQRPDTYQTVRKESFLNSKQQKTQSLFGV